MGLSADYNVGSRVRGRGAFDDTKETRRSDQDLVRRAPTYFSVHEIPRGARLVDG
jgi:hypothetical protein